MSIKHFMNIYKKSLFIWLVFFPLTLSAQFYQSGNDPASIHWKQIKTQNFQIIFPPEFEKEANRLANTLEYIYDYEGKSLGHKVRKISIILHSHSAFSNGVTSWAPKRIELYTTPPQDSYAQDWLDQLAVHELRHAVQIDKLDQGFTKILSLILGQQAIGGVAGLIPRWFLEGDAVNTETALTSTGRGRQASFEMEMKAQVTTLSRLYSYDKALLGSYRDFIPDQYGLGYPLVAWSRMKFGESVFDKDLNFVARNPYLLASFPLSLKIQTGLPNRKLYRTAFGDLKQKWENQLSSTREIPVLTWNTADKKCFTSYRFPQIVNDTTMLVVKSGMDQLTQFVLLYKNGKEKIIHTPGSYSSDNFSYVEGKYTWAEEIPDIRWSNRSFFCIKIGDIDEHQVKMLTRYTRFFAPALSPDATKIAAIEIALNNECFIVILDAHTGKILNRVRSPNDRLLQLPNWLANGKSIVIVATGKKGKSLEQFNISSESWQTLIAPTFYDILTPVDAGAEIFFVSDFNGTDNLYAYKKADGTVWQVTNSKYGAFDPNIKPNNHNLVFSQYSSQGYNVVSTTLESTTWVNVEKIKDTSIKLYEASAKQEKFNFQDSTIPLRSYPVSNYSKTTHMFNIHSWAPFYYDFFNPVLSYQAVTPGFTLLSQDKLGTCLASLGYSYNNNQSIFNTNITYNRFFPEIQVSLSYGGITQINTTTESTIKPPVTNNTLDAITNLFIPLNFTRGRFITGITPGIGLEYTDVWFYNPVIKNYQDGMTYVSYTLSAYRYSRASLRDLAPPLGVTAYGRFTNTPFENVQLGSIWYTQGRFYLPGLLNHHSLQFTVAYQEQQPERYLFASLVPFPRGYTDHTTYKLTTLSADYMFPIAYPDFHIGPVLYVKRLRSDLFYDFANNQYKTQTNPNKVFWNTENLSSMGVDLTADFHVFRVFFPINAGIRLAYLPNTESYISSFLFRIDLSNF